MRRRTRTATALSLLVCAAGILAIAGANAASSTPAAEPTAEARSAALTRAPTTSDATPLTSPDALEAFARSAATEIPLPPGVPLGIDWAAVESATVADARNMMQAQAVCRWAAWAIGPDADARQAAAILRQAPAWAALRRDPDVMAQVADAGAALDRGDATRIREFVDRQGCTTGQ